MSRHVDTPDGDLRRADAPFVRGHTDRQRLGVALSGGGIRSATFGLGVLQVLRRRGVLDQTDFVAAVSGGNYIASAHAIVAAESDPDLFDEIPPWAENSPEERWFRQHSTYMAPDPRGRALLGLNFAYGSVVNYLPFLLWAMFAGRLVGWAYSAGLQQGLGGIEGYGHAGGGATELAAIGILVSLAIFAIGIRRHVTERRGTDAGRTAAWLTRCSVAAVGVACVTALVLIVLPHLVVAHRWVAGHLRNVFGFQANRKIPEASPIDLPFGLTLSASTFVLALVATILTVILIVAARRLGHHLYVRTFGWIASFLLLGLPFLISTSRGAATGFRASDALWLTGGGVVVLFFAICMPNSRYSMHPFYRERLSTVFAIRRIRTPEGKLKAEEVAYGKPLFFSQIAKRVPESGPAYFPRLIVCAAVNLTGDRVPPGRLAASYTFEADLSGCDVVNYHRTEDLENFTGNRGVLLTLPGLMAISGAAVSPMMGKLTLRPLRLALAMTNVRLGVWLPNPDAEQKAEERPASRHNAAASSDTTGSERRQSRRARARRWIARGWAEPGAMYVLREGLGWMSHESPYLYVTDGGHWDNLGLVELLRRRCNRIVCFDATNGTDDLEAVSQALALAQAELGVEFALERFDDLVVDDHGFAMSCVVEGRFWYPDGPEGRLIIAKSVINHDMPADVLGFRRRDRRFPNHSTGDQLFDDEEFEAYRSLGRFVGGRAADALNLRHERKRRPGSRSPAEDDASPEKRDGRSTRDRDSRERVVPQ